MGVDKEEEGEPLSLVGIPSGTPGAVGRLDDSPAAAGTVIFAAVK